MAFLFASGLALLLETAGPIVAIALVAWRIRPRAEAGVWAAGLAGVPLGLATFLALFGLKVAVASRTELSPAERGVFVGFVEEVARFAIAAVLFRRAAGRPLVAGAFLGLGWGTAEVAWVLVQQVPQTILRFQLFEPGAVTMPFAPLLVLVERLGATLAHVALSGFAVAAAMAIARRAWLRTTALFVAAFAAHALLDVWVAVMFERHARAFDAGHATGLVVLEAVFLAGGAALFLAALRLGRELPRPRSG